MVGLATFLVTLLVSLKFPLFIAALGASIWASTKIQNGDLAGARNLLWVSFVASALLTTLHLGLIIFALRAGAMGEIGWSLFGVVIWGWMSYRDYRLLFGR